MIDIHMHLLYDIDDGPADIQTSTALCAGAENCGVEKIIATPHLLRPGRIDSFIQKRDERLERLKEKIHRAGIRVELYPGAEVFVNDDIFYSRGLAKATLNNGRYILVEFDFHYESPNRLIQYIEELFKLGCIPVIAHPERYTYFQRDYGFVNHLRDMDVLFQLNARSLASLGSRSEFELAYQMALCGTASFIATDTHSARRGTGDMLRMIRRFPGDIRRERLDYMLYLAPQAVLSNQPLPPVRRKRLEKRRLR
ncbi:MAG: hypothetical protein FWF05_00285 [Oscillospiraceae bacterium]|nr:hypothetical protein [Oscillospiraceae bacterium]